MTKTLSLKFWRDHPNYSKRQGFTPETEDEIACFRIGPLVIGWELYEDYR